MPATDLSEAEECTLVYVMLCILCTRWSCAMQGLASLMEYKCIDAAFPEMNGAALFQLSVTPEGVSSRA